MTNLESILKSRHYFVNKGVSSQSYDFSSSHVWIWKLEHKDGWAPKNWCFQTVVLEKTIESSLDRKEIKPVNPKGNQPWIHWTHEYIGRTEAEASTLWPPDSKSWLIGKDLAWVWANSRRWASPGASVIEKLPVNAEDIRNVGLIFGSWRSPGGEHGNTLQYSCLENPMDGGSWGLQSMGS